MTVATLRAIDPEPIGASVIEKLEEALAAAKDGDVSSVAIAVVYRNGQSGRCWSDAPSLSCLIGAVRQLEYGLLRFSEE